MVRSSTHIFLRLSLMLVLGGMLSACTETQFIAAKYKDYQGQSGSQGLFKVGKPYSIDGRTYRPTESYSYDETGIASWYGPGFHGAKTANGETFNENELTAAHRTLQLPSLVRVTNLENGRSLIVRVNDRGPFSKGRIIDVSKKASDLLGMRAKGTARVRVQVLAEESRQMAEAAKKGQDTRGREVALNRMPPATAETVVASNAPTQAIAAPPLVPSSPTQLDMGGTQMAGLEPEPVQSEVLSAPAPTESTVYTPSGVQGHTQQNGHFYPDPVVQQFPVVPTSIYIQAGSFTNQQNAERVLVNLHGLGAARIHPVVINGTQYYRVQVGPVQAVDTADRLLSQVMNRGYPDARILIDNSS